MKTKSKKLLSLLASFILLFALIGGTMVNALSPSSGDRVWIKTNDYALKGGTGARYAHGGFAIDILTTRDGHGSTPYYTAQYDGKTFAYCIHRFKTFSMPEYNLVDVTQSAHWNSLSGTAQRGIMLTTIHGFPARTPAQLGAPSYHDAYAATASIIWEFELGYRDLNGNRYNNYFYDGYIKGSPAETAYNNIVKAVAGHDTRASFHNQNIELDYNSGTGTYSKTITDINGILANSARTGSLPSGVSVSINGNNVTISSIQAVTTSQRINFQKNLPPLSQYGMLALNPRNGTDQEMIIGVARDPVQFSLNITARAFGKVKVVKTDVTTGKPLQGVTFGIYNSTNARIGELITGADGTATSGDLSAANGYYLREEKVPTGIVIDSNTHHNFNITTAGAVVNVNVGNKTQKGVITINKVDGVDKKPLGNAVFEVFANKDIVVNGTVIVAKDTLVDTITSNGGGVATTKQLELGEYRVVEKTPPIGYVIDTTPRVITLSYGAPTAQLVYQSQEVGNARQKGQINIIKTGEIFDSVDITESDYGDIYTPLYNDHVLENAEFEVYANEDIIINGNVVVAKDTLVDTIITDSSGLALTQLLELSEYRVVEKTAPEGFQINPNEYIVCLEYGGAIVNVVSESQEIYDERQRAEMKLIKQMEENEVYLDEEAYQDVRFGLFARTDLFDMMGEVIIPQDSLLEVTEIDELGLSNFLCDIPFGEYYIKEIETASGYVLDDTEYDIVFEPLDQEKLTIEFAVNDGEPILNKVIRGSIEIVKMTDYGEDVLNQGFKNRPLANAVYGVYDLEDNLVKEFEPTNEDGYSRIDDLPFGEYYVQEITPPPHFEKDESKYEFKIGEYDEEENLIDLVHLDVVNAPIIGNVSATYDLNITEGVYTGDNNAMLIALAIIAIVSLAIMLATKFYKKSYKKVFSVFLSLIMVASFIVPFGVSAKDNSKFVEIKKTESFESENFKIEFEAEIEQDGTKYVLSDEEISYKVVSEKAHQENQIVKHEEKFDSIDDKIAFENQLEKTIMKGGVYYNLVDVKYTDNIVSDRKQNVTAYTEYSNYTQRPSAPPTKEVSFTDEVTGESQTVILPIINIQRVNSLDWRPCNDIPITVNVYNADIYQVGNKFAEYNEAKPAFNGFETEILTYANLPSSLYRIVDFNWSGDSYADNGTVKRNAIATGQQYCATYRAIYGGNVNLDDISKFNATALYEASVTKDSDTKKTYEVEGVAKYNIATDEKSVIEKIAPFIIGGVLLISLTVAVILFIISKKNKLKEK